MPQLKRQRQVRQVLKNHGKELRAAVDKTRQDEEAETVLKLKVSLAAAAQQEQAAQEAMRQLVTHKLRRKGANI